jgi:cytochrome c oxidase cbb3-type subunit 3
MSGPKHEPEIVHVYDDIKEADARLPNWWLYTLYGAVAFAFVYWIAYHEYKTSRLPIDQYRADMIAAKQEEAKKLLAMGDLTDDKLVEMTKNSQLVEQGRQVFTTTCAACHGPQGGGIIGPNLTDEFWLHGGKPTDVLRTVRDGFVEKGMPAWGPQLGEAKVRAAVIYVLTLHNTNVPGGKPPQGEKVATR